MNHIVGLMIQSLQTAMLARRVAEKLSLQQPDDVYIAGLLFDFGEIVFWSLAGRSGQEIFKRLNNVTLPADKAQTELLGVTFDQLTAGLIRKWELSPLLISALQHPNRQDPYIQSLVLSHTLIKSIDTDEPRYHLAVEKLAKCIKCPQLETAQLIQQEYAATTKLTYHYLTYR